MILPGGMQESVARAQSLSTKKLEKSLIKSGFLKGTAFRPSANAP